MSDFTRFSPLDSLLDSLFSFAAFFTSIQLGNHFLALAFNKRVWDPLDDPLKRMKEKGYDSNLRGQTQIPNKSLAQEVQPVMHHTGK